MVYQVATIHENTRILTNYLRIKNYKLSSCSKADKNSIHYKICFAPRRITKEHKDRFISLYNSDIRNQAYDCSSTTKQRHHLFISFYEENDFE
jgi:hypothetical protein